MDNNQNFENSFGGHSFGTKCGHYTCTLNTLKKLKKLHFHYGLQLIPFYGIFVTQFPIDEVTTEMC